MIFVIDTLNHVHVYECEKRLYVFYGASDKSCGIHMNRQM